MGGQSSFLKSDADRGLVPRSACTIFLVTVCARWARHRSERPHQALDARLGVEPTFSKYGYSAVEESLPQPGLRSPNVDTSMNGYITPCRFKEGPSDVLLARDLLST